MPHTFEATTGVVFRLKQPSMIAVAKRNQMLDSEKPEPPVVYIEDKGREEPNEADPHYLQEMARWMARTREVSYEVMMLTGTEVESIPEGMMTHKDEQFSDYMRALQIEPGVNEYERYISWCKYVAAPNPNEWGQLMVELLKLCSVREEEVAELATLFPGEQDGESAEPDTAEGNGEQRDRASAVVSGDGPTV